RIFIVGFRPAWRGTFFCFAKRKYPKKRRPRFVGRAAPDAPALLACPGGCATRSLRSLRQCSPKPRGRLRCSATLKGPKGKTIQVRPPSAKAGIQQFPRSLDSRFAGMTEKSALGFDFSPFGGAEERRGGGSRPARLSERSEFTRRPATPSTAGKWRSHRPRRVAFSWGTFFWRSKRWCLASRAKSRVD